MNNIKEFLLSLTYARRELRAGLKGFYIFIACLALGVGAVAGVQSLSQGLIDSLRHDGRFILGGDIALRTVYQPATPEQLRFLTRNIGPVDTVIETRAMARREDGATSMLAEVKAVSPFYPLYGKMGFADDAGRAIDKTAQELVLPPVDPKTQLLTDDWGAAVGPEVLTRLNVKVGDRIMIGKRAFVIRGVITGEPDRVGAQGFSLAPRVMVSSAVFKQTGLADTGSQVYYDHRVVTPQMLNWDDMQAIMKKINDAFPKAQWRGRTCFNAAPRMERRIQQLTQFLTLIALTTLLVGGVGISNAVRSFLDSRLAHIATLKALGARGGFVTGTYMAAILALTALGVFIGLVLGAGAALAAGKLLTAKFALTDQTGIYPGALAQAACFGFLASLSFSLWPAGRAARVAPNDLFRDAVQPAQRYPSLNIVLGIVIAAQALALLAVTTAGDRTLATGFMAGAAVVFASFYAYAALIRAVLRRVRPPSRPALRLALSNLTRPGNAASGIVMSLGLGLTVLAATGLVQDNFSRLLTQDLSGDTPSFFFLDVEPGQKEAFEKFAAVWPTARDLRITPSFRGRILSVNGRPPEEALVDRNESWVIESERGFTWARTLPPQNKIVAGTWWDENYDGPPLVSIATNVARAFNISVGDELGLGLYGAEIKAKVASVRAVTWSSFTMNFAIVFSPGLISKAPANALATLIVAPAQEEALQNALAGEFPNVTAVRVRDALEMAQGMIRAVAQAVRLSAGITLLGGVLVLAGGIAASRRRHVYDAVVLKVLGATRATVLKVFLFEYGLLGLLSALLASLFGTVAAFAVVTVVMKLDWHFSFGVLAAVTGVSLGVTVLAGFAGTGRALLQNPAPYLRNQ